MKLRFPALGFLILTFAGWINRHQLDVIEYLKAENGVLREMLGRRKLRFTQSQRRRLATKAKNRKRRVLLDIGSLITPDTLLRWHRELISHKWDYSHIRNPERPRLMTDIARLIVQMAGDNPGWGYTRIQGTLSNLFWAYVYNTAQIPIAAGALFPFFSQLRNPMLAAVAMRISSLFAIGNSLDGAALL